MKQSMIDNKTLRSIHQSILTVNSKGTEITDIRHVFSNKMGFGRMNDMFLTPTEKDTLSNWVDRTTDDTISSMILDRLWVFLASFIPDTVAPNVLSLAGLLCLVHAWYLVYLYIDIYPFATSVMAISLIAAQLLFDGVDGKHAKKTMQDSPLGELFAHSCNLLGYVFSSLAGSIIIGIRDPACQWYILQIGQLLALTQHLGAFKRTPKVLRYHMFTGPGEVIFMSLIVLAIKATFGLGMLVSAFSVVAPNLALFLSTLGYTVSATNYETFLMPCLQVLYYTVMGFLLLEVLFTFPAKYSSTRNGLAFCLLYRMVPSLLFYLGLTNSVTMLDIIVDGLFMSILTTDIIVGKMANRNIHPLVVILAMLSLFNHMVSVVIVLFYYVALFYEISEFMELSMFSVTVNVYVDGAYDMCHLGHFNLFKNALACGTRLIVGVLSDESIKSYKRLPIMTLEERCAIVSTSRYVHKVIPDSPVTGLTKEFLKKHRIHLVCHSPEYDKPDDHYYAVPRAMGITRILPRTSGMSTSELIKRIQHYASEGKTNNKQQEQWDKERENQK